MGSSHSVFASIKDQRGDFIFPLPKRLFDAIHSGNKRKRTSDGDPYWPAFNAFVISPARMKKTIESGSLNFGHFVAKITELVYATDGFDVYWDQEGYHRNLLLLEFKNEAIVDSPEIRRLKEEMKEAVTTQTDYFRTAALYVRGDGNTGHANMCVFKYKRRTQVLSCRLFEPHARISSKVSRRVAAFKGLLEEVSDPKHMGFVEWGKWLLTGTRVSVHASFPASEKGLQTNSPICVQWSLIMFLVYMLNCELYSAGHECSEDKYRLALDILWDRRKDFIPLWLFFMELVNENSFPETRAQARKLMTAPQVPVHVVTPGSDRKSIIPWRNERSVNTALDYADCSSRPKGACLSPCALSDQGECYNTNLFVPSGKRRKLI